jgi:hypothetical protein
LCPENGITIRAICDDACQNPGCRIHAEIIHRRLVGNYDNRGAIGCITRTRGHEGLCTGRDAVKCELTAATPAMSPLVQQLRTTPVRLPVCAPALLKSTKIDKKANTNDCKNLVYVFMGYII